LVLMDEAHGFLGAGDGVRCMGSGFVVHDVSMVRPAFARCRPQLQPARLHDR
jgi:hypothetical protein